MPHPIAALIMHEPIPIDPDDSIELAEAIMGLARLRHWPVARDRQLLGIVSLRDLLLAPPHEPLATRHRVSEIMDTPPVIAHPDDDLLDTAILMGRYQLTCIPIVEGNDLIGIVTLTDFVRVAVDLLREEQAETRHSPTVARLMTHSPVTARVHERTQSAEMLMQRGYLRHLPVMDGEKLVGMLSDRDMLGVARSSLETPSEILIGEIMTSPPLTTTAETEAVTAAAELLDKRIGALPVLRDGRLVGILTKGDFLTYAIAALRSSAAEEGRPHGG